MRAKPNRRRRTLMRMAWDFSTEPDFQAQLDWMAAFVREEIWPLETLDLDTAQLDRALRPLQEQVKERGLWAAHLPPELGGQGFGQVKLGLMHEILGTLAVRADRVRLPGAGLGQLRDPRAGGHARSRRSAGCTRCWPATCARRSR